MPVHLAESPLTCVAVGSGRSLEEFEAIHRSQAAEAAQQPPPLLGARDSRPAARLAYTGSFSCHRNRSARIAVLGSPAPSLQAHRLVLPQCHRRQAANRGGRPRAALARADHRLLPRVGERRAAQRPEHRRDRAAAVRGRRRPRRRAVPRRLRLVRRPDPREVRERAPARGARRSCAQQAIQNATAAQRERRAAGASSTYVGLPRFPQDYNAVATDGHLARRRASSSSRS